MRICPCSGPSSSCACWPGCGSPTRPSTRHPPSGLYLSRPFQRVLTDPDPRHLQDLDPSYKVSVPYYLHLEAVLRIRDILVRIRIRESVSLTNRSGPRLQILLFFVINLHDADQKTKKIFCLLLFEGTFTTFFKDKKSERRHKTVEIKVFLTVFA
jgi:hypothetical protein